jgi:hypothetical protein
MGSNTTDEKLRRQLAERLGQESVSDLLWELLTYMGHVQHAQTSEGFEELVGAARALQPYVRLMEGVAPSRERKKDPHKRRPDEFKPPRDGDYEVERAMALKEYLSLRASLHPLVRRFRQEVLGGRLLTGQEAHAFIESPANSRFASDDLNQKGVPIVGHVAEFVDHSVTIDENNSERFVEFEHVYINPPGETFRAQLPISVAYDDLKKARFPDHGILTNSQPHYSGVLRDTEYVYFPVYPGSVLGNLAWLSLKLSEDFCAAWDEAQAAWFVLTDEAIPPRAISGYCDSATSDHLTYGTITLKIEPWVPADTVSKFYQYLQRDALDKRSHAPELRNLAVFRFVIGDIKRFFTSGSGDVEQRPPWDELMQHWNALNHSKPSWTYRYPSKFERDYYRGGRAVVEPYKHYEPFLPYKWLVP